MKKLVWVLVFLSIGVLPAFANDGLSRLRTDTKKALTQSSQAKIDVEKLKNQDLIHKRQIAELVKKVEVLQKENQDLKTRSEEQSVQWQLQLEILQKEMVGNTKILENTINQSDSKNDQRFGAISQNITSNKNQSIVFSVFLLCLMAWLLYFIVGRIKNTSSSIENKLTNTCKSLEEEAIKLDQKLVDILDNQLSLQKQALGMQIQQQEAISLGHNIEEIDHKLAIKVADEIVRIQKNLAQMDAGTKGLKQLSASVKRISDNFFANGYEIVEMLGLEYHEGMKVIANFITTDKLERDQQIITKIIKPQINYQGEMIQAAQIEVSVGE